MFENNTRKIERKEAIVCKTCNNTIPKEFLENSLAGVKNLYCQYCGVSLNLTQDSIENIGYDERPTISSNTPKELSLTINNENNQDNGFTLSYLNIQNALRDYMFQLIYQLLTSTPLTLKKIQNKKELKISHINIILKKLWNELKDLNPNDLATQELISSKRRIKNYFEIFQLALRPYKQFRKNNFALFAENIEFVFGLILGDYEFSNLTTAKKRIVLDLKKSFGFKSDTATSNSFTYTISLIIIKKLRSVLTQYHITEGNDNKLALDEIIGHVIDYIVTIKVKLSGLSEFNSSKKKKFYKTLEVLINNLKTDWIYYKSFEDHIYKLIIFVYSLSSDTDYSSNLTGLERLLYQGLKQSALFEKDQEFSPHFKLDFTLILCRIMFLRIKNSDDKTKLISQPVKMSITEEIKIKTPILDDITAGKKINSQLLTKFYKLSLEEFQTYYEKLQNKLASDLIYIESFREYLSDLVRLVFNIVHSISKKSHLTQLELAVIKDLANYNFEWFNKKPERSFFYYLNLSNQSKDDLYEDIKRCRRCQKLLTYDEYEKYGGERGKKGGRQSYRTLCRKCRRDIKSIRALRKKLRLILDLFGGKCSKCDTSLIFLPSFEFHHTNRGIKKFSWRKIYQKSYQTIKNWAIDEKVISLCGNCHSKEQAKYFNAFKHLILKNNLFKLSQKEIEELIDASIRKHPKFKISKNKPMIKYQIKRWIRKRYVVEQLYKEKCIVCGMQAKKNLPSLIFHHRIAELKTFDWGDLQDLDCEEIINSLIDENCVCLCLNCHGALHTTFSSNIEEIIHDFFTQSEISKFTSELNQMLSQLKTEITSFTFILETINFNSPLKYSISQEDIWKIKMLKIFSYLEQKEFKTKDITILCNNNYHNAYETIRKLVEKGLLYRILREGFTQKYYKFSEEGINKVKELQQKYDLHEDLKLLNNNPIISAKRMENDDILKEYPKIINKIIETKGFNEFTVKELAKSIGKSTVNISRILREKLIPIGIVKVKKSAIITKKHGSTKIYYLTEKD